MEQLHETVRKLYVDNLMSLREIEDYTKIGYTTIYRWLKVGKIKPTYIGDLLRFYEKDVKHLIKVEAKVILDNTI